MFILTVIFNENFHNSLELKHSSRFVLKQVLKIIVGTLFWMNAFEARQFLRKIKKASVNIDGIMQVILYSDKRIDWRTKWMTITENISYVSSKKEK
jgi:hypothetical protein|tara:strand:+ start:354 stop:641 length:288 start_codon:yes stop_codon:yes gene_type:complete